tara:strand:+ start:937 stop:1245 length:309 start_codon:yes stop_codon:yes gene_type:complete
MILKQIFTSFFLILLLNSCAQNVALLGPVITGASTGSAYQAGLSYGSGKAVTKITGKTTTENIKSLLNKGNDEKEDSENADSFFKTVKTINKRSGIKNLANQ